MTSRRREILSLTFQNLDNDRKGYIDAETLLDSFDAARHPEVLTMSFSLTSSFSLLFGEYLSIYISPLPSISVGHLTSQVKGCDSKRLFQKLRSIKHDRG